jgi:hypothetical protein
MPCWAEIGSLFQVSQRKKLKKFNLKEQAGCGGVCLSSQLYKRKGQCCPRQKQETLSEKQPKSKRTGDGAHKIEFLPSRCKDLNSIHKKKLIKLHLLKLISALSSSPVIVNFPLSWTTSKGKIIPCF